MQTRVILIRHGETMANVGKRYIGVTESPLTPYGKGQAKSLKKRMAEEAIEKIFVSSSKRALEFSRIAFGASRIEILTSLREMNFGIFEGLTHSQVLKKYPKIYSQWLKNPQHFNIPKAETFIDFKTRVHKALKEIISVYHGKTIAIVTHGGPIRMILSRILKLKNIWDAIPPLASISIIEFNKNKPKVLLLNDIKHYE